MFSEKKKEIAQVSPGETSEPGEVCPDEKPPEKSSILEPRSDGECGESKAENVEMISLEKSLMLGDVFDGIDLPDASVSSQHKDFFDEFELMMNESEDILVPENCVNLFEALDVNDYDDDGMAKQALDLAQTVPEKPHIATTELQADSVEGHEKVSEVPKLVESSEVTSSGVLEIDNGILAREMELEKPVSSGQVLAASVSQMVEDDDVEEGEISGDDNDNMLIEEEDYLPVKNHEESRLSEDVVDKRGEGTSKSSCSSLFSGVDVLKVENGGKEEDQTSKNQEKVSGIRKIRKVKCYGLSYLAFTKSDFVFLFFFVFADGFWN